MTKGPNANDGLPDMDPLPAPLGSTVREMRERIAELEAALDRIMTLRAGGPHISAEDGFSAALCSLDRARDIALAALQRGK